MEKKDYFFKKFIDWIFRKKSIIYLLVLALFREIVALNISDTIVKLSEDPNLQENYIHYPIMGLSFIFSGGNWKIVLILVFLICLFRLLQFFENRKKKCV